MQIQKTRNFFGLIGTLLVLSMFPVNFAASMSFMPYVTDVMTRSFGRYIPVLKTVGEGYAFWFCMAYLVLIALAGVAFGFAFHRTGTCLTIPPAIFFLVITLEKGPALIKSSGVGFWVSAVGLIVMLVACKMVSLNKKLFPFSVFYGYKAQPSAAKGHKVSRSRLAKTYLYEKRGYVGLAGVLLVLSAFFLRILLFLLLGGKSGLLYHYFRLELSLGGAIVYLLLLAGVAVAYFFRHHAFGCILSLPYVVYYCSIIIQEPIAFIAGGISLWLTLIGVILMLLSSCITLFLPHPLGCSEY